MKTIDLDALREWIDKIDQNILDLLKQRFDLVLKVWEYKLKNNLAPLQSKRWESVLNDKIMKANSMWLDVKMIEDIWDAIHEWALRLEKSVIKD